MYICVYICRCMVLESPATENAVDPEMTVYKVSTDEESGLMAVLSGKGKKRKKTQKELIRVPLVSTY